MLTREKESNDDDDDNNNSNSKEVQKIAHVMNAFFFKIFCRAKREKIFFAFSRERGGRKEGKKATPKQTDQKKEKKKENLATPRER